MGLVTKIERSVTRRSKGATMERLLYVWRSPWFTIMGMLLLLAAIVTVLYWCFSYVWSAVNTIESPIERGLIWIALAVWWHSLGVTGGKNITVKVK